MSDIQSYKDLKVWKKGITLVKEVYNAAKQMPVGEQFGLQSQMKRSAVSIPSNIAEGYGRNSSKSFSQFLKIARGSLLELETQVIIATDLRMLESNDSAHILQMILEENKMLNSLIKSIEKTQVAVDR
jgi:four helix bundle protein